MTSMPRTGTDESSERRRAWVALSATAGVTPRGCALLLAHFGNPTAALGASYELLKSVEGISVPAAGQLSSGESGRRAEALLARAESLGLSVTTPDDDDYPKRLRNLPDPPPALWRRGDWRDDDAVAVAVVGSRRPSPYGRLMAEQFGRELSRVGATVVSGLARGIDGIAHRAALDAGGRTIAVLGCGIDRYYPEEHRSLQEAIGRQGAVLTEFPLGAPPLAHHFPRRNRVISGLSLGVVVVEAGERSGSLITARLALEQGREVFAVPGNLGAGGSVGTNRLIKAGATLVEGIDDILSAVAAQLERRPAVDSSPTGHAPRARIAAGTRPVTEPLTTDEGALIEHVGSEPRHMDELAVRSGRPVQQVAVLLLSMELKGAVRQLPGNFYFTAMQERRDTL
jgi:DNA processing protein